MRLPWRQPAEPAEAGPPPLFLERQATSTIDTAVETFWAALTQATVAGGMGYSPAIGDRIWVAARCIQLNAQQIGSMPLRYSSGAASGGREPAWVTNPDPVYYPNGIGDAVFAIADDVYRWGNAYLLVTSRYADGFPSGWTVLDPEAMSVEMRGGRRQYRSGGRLLNPGDVVHIMRDPGRLTGTSALQSYAAKVWGAIATVETARGFTGEGKQPNAILHSKRKITQDEAQLIKSDWANARARGGTDPAVLPPEIDFEQLSFSPADLLLLDSQKFDASVIASAFGVPAFMLNLPLEGALIYQNPESLFEYWWRGELRPTAAKIAAAMTAAMLPRGSSVTFDATETIEPNVTDQISSWNEMLTNGVVTANEFRAAVLGLPPLEQGDAITELTQPPVADVSPAQGGAAVADLKVVSA